MTVNDTMRLEMPLLQPAQAQKHVTVNEALMRLDGLVNLVLQSVTRIEPAQVVEGQCWAVPEGAEGVWAGQGGRIAVASNGGWIFAPARAGMRGFVVDQGVQAVHDGTAWQPGVLTLGAHGSAMRAGMSEREVPVGRGARFNTDVIIPRAVMVVAAVARVVEPLTGSLSSWRLGVDGSDNRFGQGLGLSAGSWAHGMLTTPLTSFEPLSLIMTATGGEFASGRVRLAVHWWEVGLPRQRE